MDTRTVPTTISPRLDYVLARLAPEQLEEVIDFAEFLAARDRRFDQKEKRATPEGLGWPPGFFERTFGSLKDIPIDRAPQGEYETREMLA